MSLSETRARRVGAWIAASVLVSMAASNPVFADESSPSAVQSPASRDVHSSIDEALNHQRARRLLGVGGMALGGAVILGGSLASALDNHTYCLTANACSGSRHSNTGYYIAAGVGLPLLGAGIYLFTDAQHNINQLNTSRVGFGYSPGSQTPMLQASFGF
jgi:hypothetical protein